MFPNQVKNTFLKYKHELHILHLYIKVMRLLNGMIDFYKREKQNYGQFMGRIISIYKTKKRNKNDNTLN